MYRRVQHCAVAELFQEDPAKKLAELDDEIKKLAADIEKMAPNMKAMER